MARARFLASWAGLLLLAACGESKGGKGTGDGAAADATEAVEAVGEMTDAAADAEAGPGDVPDAAVCAVGEQRCLDEQTAQACQGGKWVNLMLCLDPMICLGTGCVGREECTPGTLSGCFSLLAQKICHYSGKGYVALPCAESETCLDGVCSSLVCTPGTKECKGPATYAECLEDGSGWGPPVMCSEGDMCAAGKCQSACATDPKYAMSNVGCEFWSVDLGQWDPKPGESQLEPSAAKIPYAVVVGNPNDKDVTVTFEVGDGTSVNIPDPVVPAGQARSFTMPLLSLQDSGISKKTVRLRTNRPVTAAQFNPENNEDFVHTSDASLLYPTGILGKEHYVVAMPSKIGPEFPMLGKQPSVWGYVTVVAVEEGETLVTLANLTAPTEPGPDFEGYPKGATITFTLQQWEVLNVNSLATDMMAPDEDITGTQVLSDKKTAVFGGHQCYVIGESNCDHLEGQLLPLAEWGDTYVAGRMQTPAANEYRVVSGEDGNVIKTMPSLSGLDGMTLDKGKWVHVKSDASFVVQGTGPIQVVQFIAGNSSFGDILVDPSMTPLIPTVQFRKDYPLLVPTAYDKNWVAVVRQGQAAVTVNGEAAAAAFVPIPGTDWSVANVQVQEGVNFVAADLPFGLIAYGYANKVSYAYPGGLNGNPVQ